MFYEILCDTIRMSREVSPLTTLDSCFPKWSSKSSVIAYSPLANLKRCGTSKSTKVVARLPRCGTSSGSVTALPSWGCSTVGSASALQAEGRRFKSCHFHHESHHILVLGESKRCAQSCFAIY